VSDRSSTATFSVRAAVVHVLPAGVGIPMAVALAVFLAGPRVQVEEGVEPVAVSGDPAAWVAEREAAVPGVRPGDEAAVVWADPERPGPTSVALIYLHGFSADRHELDPVPRQVAGALGANLHYARLTGHGRDGPAMAEATADDWLQDAVDALAVGRALGERVVLMGTSTGATLALWAAAREELAGRVDALVLVSPNLGPADRNSRLLLLPWGGFLARLAIGAERCFEPANEEQARHWTECYPVEALLPMMGLVERVRTLELESVRTPALVLYSPEDRVVDAGETERYAALLGSDPKRVVPVEGGGPAHHLLAGDILAPGNNDRVTGLILDFLEEAGMEGPDGGTDRAPEGGAAPAAGGAADGAVGVPTTRAPDAAAGG
jgi:pimeloyl-ACP methyl ester carboxylesterase